MVIGFLDLPSAFAQTAPTSADRDTQSAAQLVDNPQSAPFLTRLRQLATILLSIAIVIAASIYWMGYTRYAYGVLGAAIFLYLAYWGIIILVGPVDTQTGSYFAVNYGLSNYQGGSAAGATVYTVLKSGLAILGIVVTPFIGVYACMLAITAMMKELEAGQFASFLLGMVIVYSAGALGALFNVIKPT